MNDAPATATDKASVTDTVTSDGPPLPQAEPHPLRFAIAGVTDKIADLKTFVGDQEFDSALKTFIAAELDKMKTNAACLHLHDVARPDGGFDLHLSIQGIHLGGRAGAVTTGAKLTAPKE
jgi:hypothetical protein